MNVAISRISDEKFIKGHIYNIISIVQNNIVSVLVGTNVVKLSLDDDDFFFLFSATKNEVDWISKNFF